MGEPARILVVDDDKSIRAAFKAVLEAEGYIVDTAENGKEAIKKSNTNFYNVALLDFRLPDIEGTKLLTAMKENTPKMIKIMVTGYPSMKNAIESVNRDADAYLIKPVDAETLLKTISEQLKKQEEAQAYTEKKVTEYIETRTRQLSRNKKNP